MRKLSGNHASWLTTVAKEVREAGRPVSLQHLLNVVPGQFATSTNDGHVTAAENGLSRDDYRAGQRIWVVEAISALRKAGLIDGPDKALVWVAEQDGEWRVPFGKAKPTVYGRAQSLAHRDRHMLGDENAAGLLLKGWAEPLKVEVEVGIANVIDKGMQSLDVHPYALAIPPMTPEEQAAMRADVEQRGVRQPLVLYPDANDLTARGKPKMKVLDGRHRLWFASSLGKPVRVQLFPGSEEEAKREVASLNLTRRHLSPKQMAFAIAILFGEQAKAEALAGKTGRPKKGEKVPQNSGGLSNGKSKDGEWQYRAHKAAGSPAGVTPEAVRQMGEVIDAPETAARIAAGEKMTYEEAVAAARVEKGLPEQSKQDGRTHKTTVHAQLCRALSDLRVIVNEPDLPAGASPAQLEQKREELAQLVQRLLETALSSR